MNDTALLFDEEDEDSLEQPLSEEDVSNCVLFATDWTVGTVLDQLQRGNINLSPRFQRRDAWPVVRKSRYVESLMLHLPVPHIVLAERKGKKGQFLVLDGRQRLLSLMQFIGLAEDSNNNRFALHGLEVATCAEKLTWPELDDIVDLKTQLENATVRSVVIRNWQTEKVLHLVFSRLNTESVRLNAQELRLAAYPGEFVYFVDDQSVESPGVARLFGRQPPDGDSRMRDAELLVRYFAFQNCFDRYEGPMRPFLDSACSMLNRSWEARMQEIRAQMDSFETAVKLGFECFEDGFGKRWIAEEDKFGGRQNRAVLDVLLHYLAKTDPATVRAEPAKYPEVMKDLFRTNAEFVESIDATARHAAQSVARFPIFGEALLAAGIDVPVSRPQNG